MYMNNHITILSKPSYYNNKNDYKWNLLLSIININ